MRKLKVENNILIEYDIMKVMQRFSMSELFTKERALYDAGIALGKSKGKVFRNGLLMCITIIILSIIFKLI